MSATIERFESILGYKQVLEPWLENLRTHKPDEYLEALRLYGSQDLYFLLLYVLSTRNFIDKKTGTKRMEHPYVLDFCREVEASEHDVADIRAREHVKTTVKTWGRNIQRIANDPDVTIAIVSETERLAASFSSRILDELESNRLLYDLWPEVFWENPRGDVQAKKSWSKFAFTVKRDAVLSEATVTAVGLDSFRSGPHYAVLSFDDPITKASVTNEEQIFKSIENWKKILSLGREDGIRTYAGTFYSEADLWNHLREGEKASFRIVPCYDAEGNPVYYPREYLEDKRRQIGEEEFGIQWLCDPFHGRAFAFDRSTLREYPTSGEGAISPEDFHHESSTYILVDPATEKHKKSDFTVMLVFDVALDGIPRLVDGVRDRLDPGERVDTLLRLWERWGHDGFIECRYEEYGMQTDIWWLQREQVKQGKVFPVVPVGGTMAKKERIKALIPVMRDGGIILPDRLTFKAKYRNGAEVDLVRLFKNEMAKWPLSEHDDLLDCTARLFLHEPLVLPSARRLREQKLDAYERELRDRHNRSMRPNWVA